MWALTSRKSASLRISRASRGDIRTDRIRRLADFLTQSALEDFLRRVFRLAAAAEALLAIAERVDGEIVDEAILAELHELHDRAQSALRQLSEHER
jgi:hypothetical protein